MHRIAVIEDSKTTNDEFKEIVLDMWSDCQVDQFYDVTTAIQAIAQFSYDIIISDIDLGPGSDVNGALKIAQALDSQSTPLLIVSGSPQPELQRGIYRALRAWDYLQKPISSQDLKIQLERAMIVRQVMTNTIMLPETPKSPDPNIFIDKQNRNTVFWKGERLNLTITQVLLVQLMLKNVNSTTTFEQMFPLILTGKNKDNIRVHIGEIKAAFKSVDPEFNSIKTKIMIGYSWIA